MKKGKHFRGLTRFELILWHISLFAVTGAFLLCGDVDYLLLATSLVGVTALIFIAKGDVLGQLLAIIFSILYAIISYRCRYYGEMITYLGMSAPMAAFAIVSWARHPYKKGSGGSQVKVRRMKKSDVLPFLLITTAVTAVFYFVLKFTNTSNLAVSTVSITTSFAAAYFMFMRSPLYAAAYAANDVVLIVLWVLAMLDNPSYLSMVVCFSMFLFNDIYALYNWRRMSKWQKANDVATNLTNMTEQLTKKE